MNFSQTQTLIDMMFVADADGNATVRHETIDPDALPPLVLAYVGDAWFHLFVRIKLLSYEQSQVRALNDFSAKIVSAAWQSRAAHGIESLLTEREQDVFRRGRNAKSHPPRAASFQEYHASTGFEALLGWLYLKDDPTRLKEISEAAFKWIVREMMNEKDNKGERLDKSRTY